MTTIYFTEDHDWIELLEENRVRIGITEYAQEQLGDVVYVELPEVDDELEAGDELGTVESVKSVSEILSPVTGIVLAINENLEDEPELVNDDAMGAGWFVEIQAAGEVDTSTFLTEEQYQSQIEEE